jgi:alpha-beta hydrolase superfamily lysophospholipase
LLHEDGSLSARSGALFYQQRWSPEQDIKGCVLLVHGLGEYSGRYKPLADYLVAGGYALCALDLPGHGYSEGRRGYIDAFSVYLETVEDYMAELRQRYPDTPLFLLGHSMGGLISACLLLSRQSDFNGAILSGPAIAPPEKPPAIQQFIVRMLSRLAPTVGVMQLDANGVSRDPVVVEKYKNDPLIYTGKISARSVVELFDSMEEIQNRASEITLPLLVLHGEADSMTPAAGSQLLHQRVASADKTLTIYPGLYHEIFNEPEHPQIYAELRDWLDAH